MDHRQTVPSPLEEAIHSPLGEKQQEVALLDDAKLKGRGKSRQWIVVPIVSCQHGSLLSG